MELRGVKHAEERHLILRSGLQFIVIGMRFIKISGYKMQNAWQNSISKLCIQDPPPAVTAYPLAK